MLFFGSRVQRLWCLPSPRSIEGCCKCHLPFPGDRWPWMRCGEAKTATAGFLLPTNRCLALGLSSRSRSCSQAAQINTGLQWQALSFRWTNSFQATQWPLFVQRYRFVSRNCIYYLGFNERHLVNYTGKHYTEGNTGTLSNSSCYSAIFIIHMPSRFSVWGASHCNKVESKDAISWHLATLDIKV